MYIYIYIYRYTQFCEHPACPEPFLEAVYGQFSNNSTNNSNSTNNNILINTSIFNNTNSTNNFR